MLEGAGPTPEFIETDTDGRYRFDKLPSGTFRVRVEKPGFVRSKFGAKRPFVQPPPISSQRINLSPPILRFPGRRDRGPAVQQQRDAAVQENATVSAVRLMYG